MSIVYFPPIASYRNCACCDFWWHLQCFLSFTLMISLKYWPHLASLHASPCISLLSSRLFFCCLLHVAVPWGSLLHALLLSLHESFFTPIISLLRFEIIHFPFPTLKERRNWIQSAYLSNWAYYSKYKED